MRKLKKTVVAVALLGAITAVPMATASTHAGEGIWPKPRAAAINS